MDVLAIGIALALIFAIGIVIVSVFIFTLFYSLYLTTDRPYWYGIPLMILGWYFTFWGTIIVLTFLGTQVCNYHPASWC